MTASLPRNQLCAQMFARSTPIATIAANLSISRDTVYSDLRSLGIEPDQSKREPWWHPHYLGHKEKHWWFRPFTGHEAEPAPPSWWENVEYKWDVYEQFEAARHAWKVPRWIRAMVSALGEGAPVWRAYAAAKAAVDAAMTALESAPDNMWRASVAQVTRAHDALLEAAKAWDYWCYEQRGREREYGGDWTDSDRGLPSVVKLAPNAAIDISEWELSYEDGEDVTWAEKKIAENEAFIKRLNGLAQPGTGEVPFSRHW